MCNENGRHIRLLPNPCQCPASIVFVAARNWGENRGRALLDGPVLRRVAQSTSIPTPAGDAGAAEGGARSGGTKVKNELDGEATGTFVGGGG